MANPMDDQNYWTRQGPWEMASFVNPEELTVPLAASCGKGTTLVIGRGADALVGSLRGLGVDALGTADDARHTDRPLPDPLPFEDERFDTVLACGALDDLTEPALNAAVGEMRRVARRAVFALVSTAPDPTRAWHPDARPREWWERLFLAGGFRRHPCLHAAAPFVALDDEPWRISLVVEKASGPLDHAIDWSARGDREADAHMAVYALASRFVRPDDRVLDFGAGCGFGSAILAAGCPQSHVTGWESDERLRSYAQRHFAAGPHGLSFEAAHTGQEPFDLVVVAQPFGPTARGLRDALEAGVSRCRPGATLFCAFPARAGVASTDGVALQELLSPPVPRLTPRHVFAVNWRQERRLRPLKLPCHVDVEADAWVVAYSKEPDDSNRRPVSPPRSDRIVVLAHHFSGGHHAAWLGESPHPVDVVHRFGAGWTPPPGTGLVVSLEAYDEPGVSALHAAVECGVPTLMLADGVVEYRNTWDHPQNLPGAIMQPAIGHKIACMGPRQARILESWGNFGKCESVGVPRFDRLLGRRVPRFAGGLFRVLVATAKTPYFTPEQRAQVVQGLQDAREFFRVDAASASPQFDAVWRVPPDVAEDLRLGPDDRQAGGPDVAAVLEGVHGVVTTPSTLMVEAMVLGAPVAVLDYTNSPRYYSSAWSISAASHLAPTLRSLREPAPSLLQFQEYALHDLCRCSSAATPRLLRLMSEMVTVGERARIEGTPLAFPLQVVPPDATELALPDNAFDLERLYPGHPQFRVNRLSSLRYEVGLLRRLNEDRASDLNRFERELRGFEVDVQKRHAAVSDFERSVLAYRGDLERWEGEIRSRERTAARDLLETVCELLESCSPPRPVYCWGTGELGRRVAALEGVAGSLAGFIDSDPSKSGVLHGRVVSTPNALSQAEVRPYVLVASVHSAAIRATLERMGFLANRDFVVVPEFS